jgi:hypothetical protein
VVEIKATSPEPHVVPATEESIIEVPTESGDEIVTADGDPRENQFLFSIEPGLMNR